VVKIFPFYRKKPNLTEEKRTLPGETTFHRKVLPPRGEESNGVSQEILRIKAQEGKSLPRALSVESPQDFRGGGEKKKHAVRFGKGGSSVRKRLEERAGFPGEVKETLSPSFLSLGGK